MVADVEYRREYGTNKKKENIIKNKKPPDMTGEKKRERERKKTHRERGRERRESLSLYS